MALSLYEWIHVAAALALVGAIALLFVRARATPPPLPGVVTEDVHATEGAATTAPPIALTNVPTAPIDPRPAVLHDLAMRAALPLALLVALTGLLARALPWSGTAPLMEPASLSRIAILAILLVVLFTGVIRPLAKLKKLVLANEADTPAADKLWSDWRGALLSAGFLALLSVGLLAARELF